MDTVKDVKDIITKEFCANKYMKYYYKLDDSKTFEEQFSFVSFENILFDVLASVIFIVLQLVNRNNKEVDQKIDTFATHGFSWYRTQVLRFQYGFSLLPDSCEFDNSNATDEQIEASKIIKQCSVVKRNRRLIIKVAKEVNNEFEALNTNELNALIAYLEEIKDAGVEMTVVSTMPDKFKLSLTVRYIPFILDNNGVNLNSGKKTIEVAIKSYLKKLPFDGKLSLMKLVDVIQDVEGVEDLKINGAWTSWINHNSYNIYKPIDMSVIPESGWFKTELEISYEVAG